MKEICSRARKHDSAVRSKQNAYSDHRDREIKVHSKNILKETHHKNYDEERSRRKKESDLKNSSHSKSRYEERSNSPHHIRRSHHKKDAEEPSYPSEREEPLRRRKNHRENEVGESYEELSRRKRRIESELHALDLEEAAQKEAEKKKSRKEVSGHSKRREHNFPIKEEVKPFRIKQEPISDDSDTDRYPSDHNRKNSQKHKHNSRVDPKTAEEEEGSWGKPQTESKTAVKEKEKPNFSTSGKLAEDTNTYNGVVIKYNEPAEARKPRRKWRLYPFKGDTNLPFIPIHRQSAYLFGRSRLIADIPIDHPSCSKQHAVLQFRLVPYKRDDGSTGKRVRPYIIDLESSNGTFVNNKRVDHRCYVELIEKDVVKFGYSSREYVLLHEESKNDSDDDDIIESND